MQHPNLSKPGIVLGLVEAWPSRRTHCGEGQSDGQPRPGPARDAVKSLPGRDGGKSRSNKGNGMNKEDAAM
jgi:hypothetical protein